MQRFFLDPQAIDGIRVSFPPETSRQILNVLRLKPGQDEVMVLDDSGRQYRVQLLPMAGKSLYGEVLGEDMGASEPRIDLCLAFSLTRRERLEWILQKGTELGVTRFQPFISAHSVVRQLEADKQNRLKSIIREAAEQSERSRLPQLLPPMEFQALLPAAQDELRLMAWERDEAHNRLRRQDGAAAVKSAIVLVGPEGGFSQAEVELAMRSGYRTFSLGPRVLRVETACIAAATLVLHEFEG